MKKTISVVLAFVFIVTLIGCSTETGNDDLSAMTNDKHVSKREDIDWSEETVASITIGNRLCDTMGFPDQSVPPKYEWVNLSETDDIEIEYNNFEVTLDYRSYKTNSKIRIHVSNKNNKPYSYYPVPYVEKHNTDNDTWERLIYAPDEVYYSTAWSTGLADVTLYFNPNFMARPMESGEYRFIVFAGEKAFYSDSFTVTKP